MKTIYSVACASAALFVSFNCAAAGLGKPIPIKSAEEPATQQAVPEARMQTVRFEVSPADGNFRGAIAKWAQQVGWTFLPEHWSLSRDIPVAGTDVLGPDFKSAVRSLLASTAGTELPAKPCFYSNSVVRVIPLTESCQPQREAQ